MINKETIAQFLFGSTLNYSPLFIADAQVALNDKESSIDTFTFNYQKTSEVKNYVPSKRELDDLLQDNAVKDKEVWKEDIAYLEMLRHSRRQEEFNKKSFRNVFNQVIKIVSIPIILILPAITINFHIQNKANEELYSQFYGSTPSTLTLSEQSAITGTSFDKAQQSYINRNYSYAQKLFERVSPGSYNYHLSQFYCGICNMEQNRFDVALIHFKKIEQDVRLSPYLSWYKGLCYIKLGTLKNAIPILVQLEKSNNQFSAKAGELLAKIKK